MAASSPDFQERMRDSSEVIQGYTYPLLVDIKGVPELIASCFFLDVLGHVFLVTASHVVRRKYGEGLLTRGSKQLVVLHGDVAATRSLHRDNLDVAVLRVGREFVAAEDIKVVPMSMFAGLANIQSVQARAISGYPVSKNKRGAAVDAKAQLFTARSYTFFGNVLDESDYARFGKSPLDHVGIHYQSPGTDHDGRLLTRLPSPRGMSGGGTWLVPDFGSPTSVFLEGVFIECHDKAYAFATRLENVIEFISHTHPGGVLTSPNRLDR